MNLRQCRVVLRPRSVSEVLDLALRVITCANPRLYAWLSALVLLPALVACLLLRHLGLEWAWVWLVALTIGSLAQGVFTVAAGRLLFSEQLGVREVVGHFARRFGSYFGAWSLSRALLALGAIASFLIFPLFWAWTRVAFVHEASLLEQADTRESLRRAARFVAARGASTLGLLTFFLLSHVGFVAIAELLGNVGVVQFVLQLGEPLGSLTEDGGSAFALAGFFLSIPYVATARFLAYIDQRTRLDGWDIQLRCMAIAAAHSEPRSEAA